MQRMMSCHTGIHMVSADIGTKDNKRLHEICTSFRENRHFGLWVLVSHRIRVGALCRI